MTTMPHETSKAASTQPRGARRLLTPDVWASLAISAMWLAVALAALFGPDFVSAGVNQMTRIPSAIVIALFAYLGTRVVARYGFDRSRESDR
jgi:hypothetical protein